MTMTMIREHHDKPLEKKHGNHVSTSGFRTFRGTLIWGAPALGTSVCRFGLWPACRWRKREEQMHDHWCMNNIFNLIGLEFTRFYYLASYMCLPFIFFSDLRSTLNNPWAHHMPTLIWPRVCFQRCRLKPHGRGKTTLHLFGVHKQGN